MRLAALGWTGEGARPHTVLCGLRPVTLLEFLTGTARARIVAAHFFLPANDLLHRLNVSGARHASLFQFATLAAHEGFFQVIG